MNANRAQHLYRIDRTTARVLHIAVYVMLILAAFAGMYKLLTRCGISWSDSSLWQVCLLVYKYTWYACGITACACVLLRICLSPFVKSEEQEDFERKVEYVLQQKEAEKMQKSPISSEYSPLMNLTPEQETQVKQFLHELPAHPTKPTHINLALIAQYLTALEQLEKANLSNKGSLRGWVMQVTDKEVPSTSQFNEAIPNKNRPKLVKAREKWKELLSL